MMKIVYILFIAICLQQNVTGRSRRSPLNQFEPDELKPVDNIRDELLRALDNVFDGTTHMRSSLPSEFISDSGWIDSNQYFLKVLPTSEYSFLGKILVGSSQEINDIETVVLTFYDQNGNVLQDDFGQALQYTATRLELGHLFELSHRSFDYAYAKLLLKLQPNSHFDPNDFFLHFARPSIEELRSTYVSDSNLDSIYIPAFSVHRSIGESTEGGSFIDQRTVRGGSTREPTDGGSSTRGPTVRGSVSNGTPIIENARLRTMDDTHPFSIIHFPLETLVRGSSTRKPTEESGFIDQPTDGSGFIDESTDRGSSTLEPIRSKFAGTPSPEDPDSGSNISRNNAYFAGSINSTEAVNVFEEKTFTASCLCPENASCLWMLREANLFLTLNNSLKLIFRPYQIGDHTLSYGNIINGVFMALCSHAITVEPKLETAILLYPIENNIIGLWNTTAGDRSELSSPSSMFFIPGVSSLTGTYNFAEMPTNALDRKNDSKYNSHGSCDGLTILSDAQCGLNTGFQATLGSRPSLLVAFRFRTGNDLPERDPIAITIEGSNHNSSLLTVGSSWTLIYSGTTGLASDPGRGKFGSVVSISNNRAWFTSYRILVTQKRQLSSAVQYADIELFGYYD